MTIVIITVIIALLFDVVNGFHDAANSIATIVSTKVLSPKFAVLWAAFFNFIAMFIFAPRVANTIANIVNIDSLDPAFGYVVFSALLGYLIFAEIPSPQFYLTAVFILSGVIIILIHGYRQK